MVGGELTAQVPPNVEHEPVPRIFLNYCTTKNSEMSSGERGTTLEHNNMSYSQWKLGYYELSTYGG